MREKLDQLIEEMLEKGIRYDEAHREFERRFILRALTREEGSLRQTADRLGMHRNTLTRKIGEYKLKRPR